MSVNSEEATRPPSMAEEQSLLGREASVGSVYDSLIGASWASVSRKSPLGRVWSVVLALSCLSFWSFSFYGIADWVHHTPNAYLVGAYLVGSSLGGSVSGLITFGYILSMEDSIRRILVDHRLAVRIVKVVVNFVVSGLAARHVESVHQNTRDFSTAFWETNIPLFGGLIVTAAIGMILEEEAIQVLEGVGSALEVLMVLFVAYKRLEAVFVSIFFAILCVLTWFYQPR